MTKKYQQVLIGMLLFSAFGLVTEVVFTGVTAAGLQGSFKGYVSLLMIPVYSFSYLLGLLCLPLVKHKAWFKLPWRLPIIVIIIYIIEWAFGAFYQSINLLPWHYDHGWASEFSDGNITLYFVPAWLIFALIVVPVLEKIKSISKYI